jgi:hypothetical protein
VSDDPLSALFATLENAPDLPAVPERAAAGEDGEEGDAGAAGGTAEAAEEQPEEEVVETPPIELELSEEVEALLKALDEALGGLGKSAAGFLDTHHLEVAELAGELEPVHAADELDGTMDRAAAWSSSVDANLQPFRDVVTGAGEAAKAAGEYLSELKKVFANAIVPEPPAEGEAGA